MYEEKLLYRKSTTVNWCEDCHTVLANEQVEEGCCWRCDNEVTQKQMPGYYVAITKYAQELLDDLKDLEEDWPSQVLTMQENWIGRSEGLEFKLELSKESRYRLDKNFAAFEVFTTRPDTIYGVTYSALAPEHPIVKYIVDHNLLPDKKIRAIKDMQKVSERDRATQDKEGISLEIDVMHPLTGEKIPVWVANFVLASYGGGAVMAVPAHDQRDFEFAKQYDLPMKQVIVGKDGLLENQSEAYTYEGELINSESFTGLKNTKAKKAIVYHFEQNSLGIKKINFKLRDWGISRQRYWGAPIPFVHCDDCGLVPEKSENLPVALPDDVERLFDKTVPTGKNFGTITVIIEHVGYETTTYRLETEYTDGRRPKSISYAKQLIDDLSRRDFTINALAMSVPSVRRSTKDGCST